MLSPSASSEEKKEVISFRDAFLLSQPSTAPCDFATSQRRWAFTKLNKTGRIFLTIVKGLELHLRSPTNFQNIWCAALGLPVSYGVPPVERRNWLGAKGLAKSFTTPLGVLRLLRATSRSEERK